MNFSKFAVKWEEATNFILKHSFGIMIGIVIIAFILTIANVDSKNVKENYITSQILKCMDYEKMNVNVKTKWLKGYEYCINLDTKERIQL